MGEPPVLSEVISVRGHRIRLTLRQWLHISENHDYIAGNRTLVLETIADPDELLAGEAGETLALRAYPQINLTAKTAVGVYWDEPEGFIITAWLTSRADRVRAKGVQVWMDYDAEGDVLYVSFAMPQQATDSVMGEDGMYTITAASGWSA
jgi:hypothetical protein